MAVKCWGVEPASKYCESVKDGTHDSPKQTEFGYKLITSKHIANGSIDLKSAYYISQDDYDSINKRSKVDINDILISMIGTVGRVCRITETPDFAIKNMGLFKISDALKSKWLYYYLKSPEAMSYINAVLAGSTQKYISLGALRDFPIRFPLSKELMAANVLLLDTIDKKIELNNRINDYLEQCLLARYDQVFGNANAYNGTISDIGDVTGGATPSKKKPEYYCHNGIGWITPRDLSSTSDKFIAHGADDITRSGFDSCSAKKLPTGSVLFSSRAPIGYIAIAADEITTNQGFKSVVPHREIGTAFVYCFLVRNRDRIADTGSGTTFPEVSSKTMASIELALPDVALCAQFEEWATPILAQQHALEKENHELAKLRDTLLPKLMSGEIDVSQIDIMQLNNHLDDC